MTPQEGHNSGFSMPENYFSEAAYGLQNRLEWLEEHKAFPALKMAWRKQVFAVPEAYFDKKEAQLELLEYESLMMHRAPQVFAVPASYQVERSEIYLQQFKSESVFAVPETYFTEQAQQLVSNLADKKRAKIISINFKRFSFAAAAAVVVVISGYLYNHWSSPPAPADCGGIACVDRAEVLQLKNFELLEDEDLINTVDALKLEQALQGTTGQKHTDSVLDEEDLIDNL